METLDFLRAQFERTILESMAVLLEDLNIRLSQQDCNPSQLVLKAESGRLIGQIKFLMGLPVQLGPCGADTPQAPGLKVDAHARITQPSRIVQGIVDGSIKQKPSGDGDSDNISFGMGKVEITENDEVVDEILPDNVTPLKRKTPSPKE